MTKWFKASSLLTDLAKCVALFLLKSLFSRHDSPGALISDNSLNFTTQVITELSILFGTFANFAAPYYPATDGAVKRANSTLISILFKMVFSDPLHLPPFLDTALLAY